MKAKVYLDFNATHPILPQVLEAVVRAEQEAFGNPSSLHWAGRAARKALHEARRKLALGLGVSPDSILFTGSATEANNLVFRGHYEVFPSARTYVVSTVEHPSVLRMAEALKNKGARVLFLAVDRNGQVNLGKLRVILEEAHLEGGLLSLMAANNETGVLFPVSEAAEIAHSHGMLFHTDAVQALGKVPFYLGSMGVDFASFSAHKIGGPKGVGLLYVKNKRSMEPFILGGSQEFGLRAGTENVAGAVGFANAFEIASERLDAFETHTRALKEMAVCRLKERIDGVLVHSEGARTLPSTLNIGFEGVDGDALLMGLDMEGYALSSGSACSSGKIEASHVLLAMDVPRRIAQASLRVSLSLSTTRKEVEGLCDAVEGVVARLRASR
jgi:cysteine desulfurase